MPNEFDDPADDMLASCTEADAERDAMIRDHRAMQIMRRYSLQLALFAFSNGLRWGVVNGSCSVDGYHDDPATALLSWEAKFNAK